ncbi:hypothetical protein [Thermosulfuriphilus sp.]
MHKHIRLIVAALCLFLIIGSLKEVEAKKRHPEKLCLVGKCWQNIDVEALGETGCPAPGLILYNVIKELNSYLAAKDFLKLSKKQYNTLKDIRFQFQTLLMERRAKLQLLSLSLIESMAIPNGSSKKINDTIEELQNTCRDLLTKSLEYVCKAREVLTAEQLSKARRLTPRL